MTLPVVALFVAVLLALVAPAKIVSHRRNRTTLDALDRAPAAMFRAMRGERGILYGPGLTEGDRAWIRAMWVGPPDLIERDPGRPGRYEVPSEPAGREVDGCDTRPGTAPSGEWDVARERRAPGRSPWRFTGRPGQPVHGDQVDPTLIPGHHIHPDDQTLTLPEL